APPLHHSASPGRSPRKAAATLDGSQPRLHGSTNTSSTRGFPESPLNATATWAVPPDGAPRTAEFVNTTGVGAHPPPAATTPAGTTELPSTKLTATDPVPPTKNRIDGSVA